MFVKKMNLISLTFVLITLNYCDSYVLVTTTPNNSWNTYEIQGYHFHTYFFQNNNESRQEAFELR